MYAITVKQPWAEAIARHGKTVENRTRRPPAHLIGQRIAIHVGQSSVEMSLAPLYWSPRLPHLLPLREFALAHPRDVPHAGRIIATARLVGWRTVDQFCPGEAHVDGVLTEAAKRSPWFTGPVGWVLADVRPLAVPIGHIPDECRGAPDGREPRHDWGLDLICGLCGERRAGGIRGQLYPFALSAEVEATILRQGVSHG